MLKRNVFSSSFHCVCNSTSTRVDSTYRHSSELPDLGQPRLRNNTEPYFGQKNSATWQPSRGGQKQAKCSLPIRTIIDISAKRIVRQERTEAAGRVGQVSILSSGDSAANRHSGSQERVLSRRWPLAGRCCRASLRLSSTGY